MNKINGRKRQIIFVLLLAYLIGLISFYFVIRNIPKNYMRIENEHIENAQIALNDVLNAESDMIQLAAQLEVIAKEYPMELIVKKQGKTIFTTFPGIEIQTIESIINPERVIFRQQGEYESNQGTYIVMYCLYQISATDYLGQQIWMLALFIGVLFLVLSFIVIFMEQLLFTPLKVLQQAIQKMRHYEFDDFSLQSDDAIVGEFQQFSDSLQTRMSTVSEKYTELELLLLFEKERQQMLLKVFRAAIHELKTPIHRQLLENEIGLSEENQTSQSKELIEYNVEVSDQILQKINGILVLMEENSLDFDQNFQRCDIPNLLDKLENEFGYLLQNRKLSLDMIVPNELIIETNILILELILHTIIANVVTYSLENTEVEFTVDFAEMEPNNIVFVSKNETTPNNIVQLQQQQEQNVFKRLTDNDNVYSSGQGIHLARELAKMLNGTLEILLSASLNEVQIVVKIPTNKVGGKI